MMWFLQGPCGHTQDPVPASCGFFAHRESSPGLVLFPRAWAGSLDGTLFSPCRPPSLSLLGLVFMFCRKGNSASERDSCWAGVTQQKT